MSLFKNKINIETGQVFSLRNANKEIGCADKDGYIKTSNVYDCYGNVYYLIHQIIFAEANNYPKHLWPIDENGKRYEVDHIIPVSEGGSNSYRNLRLISRQDNNGTERTRINHSKRIFSEETRKKMSESHKGIIPKSNPPKKVYQYTLDGVLVGIYESTRQAERDTGFRQVHICKCCSGKKKQYKGFQWSYKPLN